MLSPPALTSTKNTKVDTTTATMVERALDGGRLDAAPGALQDALRRRAELSARLASLEATASERASEATELSAVLTQEATRLEHAISKLLLSIPTPTSTSTTIKSPPPPSAAGCAITLVSDELTAASAPLRALSRLEAYVGWLSHLHGLGQAVETAQAQGDEIAALAHYHNLVDTCARLKPSVCTGLTRYANALARYWHAKLTAALQRDLSERLSAAGWPQQPITEVDLEAQGFLGPFQQLLAFGGSASGEENSSTTSGGGGGGGGGSLVSSSSGGSRKAAAADNNGDSISSSSTSSRSSSNSSSSSSSNSSSRSSNSGGGGGGGRSNNNDATTTIGPMVSSPVNVFLQPLLLRFRFHFCSDEVTARRDRPAWCLRWVEDIAERHGAFLRGDLQRLLDAAGRANVRAADHVLGGLLNACRVKFGTELLGAWPPPQPPLSSSSVGVGVSRQQLCTTARLILGTDARLRETHAYDGRPLFALYLEDAPQQLGRRWLRAEARAAAAALTAATASKASTDASTTSSDAGGVGGGGGALMIDKAWGQRPFASAGDDVDTLRAPYAAHVLVHMVTSLLRVCEQLPTPLARANFAVGVIWPRLADFRLALSTYIERTLWSLATPQQVTRLCARLNAVHLAVTALRRWSSDITVLELAASAQTLGDGGSVGGGGGGGGLRTQPQQQQQQQAAAQVQEATSAAIAMLRNEREAYGHMEADLVERLANAVAGVFRREARTWSESGSGNGGGDGGISGSKTNKNGGWVGMHEPPPSPACTGADDVTHACARGLRTMTALVKASRDALALPLQDSVWRGAAAVLCAHVNETVLCRDCDANGAAQLALDLRALADAFANATGGWPGARALFVEIIEPTRLLTLEQGSWSRISSLLKLPRHADDARTALNDIGVRNLSLQRAKQILLNRIDLLATANPQAAAAATSQ